MCFGASRHGARLLYVQAVPPWRPGLSQPELINFELTCLPRGEQPGGGDAGERRRWSGFGQWQDDDEEEWPSELHRLGPLYSTILPTPIAQYSIVRIFPVCGNSTFYLFNAFHTLPSTDIVMLLYRFFSNTRRWPRKNTMLHTWPHMPL